MRTIALSMTVVSGAMMAAAGTLAEAISTNRDNSMDNWGILVVLAGIVLMACDLFSWGPSTDTGPVDDADAQQRRADFPSS